METNAAVRGTFAAQSSGVIDEPLPGTPGLVKGRGTLMAAHVCMALAILFFIIAFIWAIWCFCKSDDCDDSCDRKNKNLWPYLLFILALALAILAIYLKC